MKLVVVESPTKARTLSRFLGGEYKIVASMGHVRDLPKSEMGIDVEKDFTPRYIVPRDKAKNVKLIRAEAVGSENILLATDPDREGEAIAYHVKFILTQKAKSQGPHFANASRGKPNAKFERIVFHEITKDAILESLKHPREIDLHLYDAQQARRVLDRLVGYSLSPLLWYKIKKGLSAGRVQSVALRLIVDREREILAFVPVEYWQLKAKLDKGGDLFVAILVAQKGEKIEIKNKEQADGILSLLKSANYLVSNLEKKEVKRNAFPPFTTSTMQQSASNRLGLSARQAMRLAQDLYEEGFITYHRTDSLSVAVAAIASARAYVEKQYGKAYLPDTPNYYKTKSRGAQEAHEAIRPTDIGRERVELSPQHGRLYDLIRLRFLASQMNPAVYSQTSVDISTGEFVFRAVGTLVKFAGWRVIYGVKDGDRLAENEEEVTLPELSVGDQLKLTKLLPEQKFTQPPARFSEATLIKALEEYGIGRPSTYAPTISTILDRGYIIREERRLKPTDLGMTVIDFLVKYFPKIVDSTFTATMEENLDKIARGESQWVPIIAEFFKPFAADLERVKRTAEKVIIPVEETGEKCPTCGNALVIRSGKFGKFVACSTFPNCKYTKNLVEKVDVACPKCGGNMVLKRTRKGRPFYGCSNYPKCDFASWTKPVKQV